MENNENKTKDISFHLRDNNLFFAYPKTKNLITALFMVTDIMDKEEGIRNKLRNIGLEIISDMHSSSYRTDILISNLIKKVSAILSFLDIAIDLSMVTKMNGDILKKEFSIFNNSLLDSQDNYKLENSNSINALFKKEEINTEEPKRKLFEIMNPYPIGHQGLDSKDIAKSKGQALANIGLQKGSTLLKALKEIELSNKNKLPQNKKTLTEKYDKNIVNNENKNRENGNRRDEIIKIIKVFPNGLTITEIKQKAKGELVTLSDKTLQRELVSMVEESVLYRTGEKRWSRYFIKN